MAFFPIPDQVYKHITEIVPKALVSRGIKLLLADLDNTLAQYGQNEPDAAVVEWRVRLRDAGVTLFLLSNNRRPTRVGQFAKALGAPVLGHANKPSTRGYRAAMERMGCGPEETAMVGDQIFTDILGAKRVGILALLVEPMECKGNPGRCLRYAVETPFRAAGRRRARAFN